MLKVSNENIIINDSGERFEYDNIEEIDKSFVSCELPRHNISGSLFVGRRTTEVIEDGVVTRESTETKIWIMEEDENVELFGDYSKEQLAVLLAKRCEDFEASGKLKALIHKYSQ